MTHPCLTASGIIAESPVVLVDPITYQGVFGRGIVFTHTTVMLKPAADLIQKPGNVG
jgi:hypothetical protein